MHTEHDVRMGKRFSRRFQSERKKRKTNPGINLVSLMDIFTILVFFLLVNSAEVQTLSSNSSVTLPESVSEEKPKENLLILVSQESIVVQGKEVEKVVNVMKPNVTIIEALQTELHYQAKRILSEKVAQQATGEVTIMGDKEIPYQLLKKIMLTCAEANFGNISLAVQQTLEAQVQ